MLLVSSNWWQKFIVPLMTLKAALMPRSETSMLSAHVCEQILLER